MSGPEYHFFLLDANGYNKQNTKRMLQDEGNASLTPKIVLEER